MCLLSEYHEGPAEAAEDAVTDVGVAAGAVLPRTQVQVERLLLQPLILSGHVPPVLLRLLVVVLVDVDHLVRYRVPLHLLLVLLHNFQLRKVLDGQPTISIYVKLLKHSL